MASLVAPIQYGPCTGNCMDGLIASSETASSALGVCQLTSCLWFSLVHVVGSGNFCTGVVRSVDDMLGTLKLSIL